MKLRFSATIFVAILFAAAAAAEEEPSKDESVKPLGPITEPPIKLIHVLNPGEREYLSPNLIGLQNIAMTHLPLSMNFVNIIDAFREIVNGVRYEIVLNAIDIEKEKNKKEDKDVICRLVILEKPWLRTEWGDKVRELVNSNCTTDADNLTDPMDKAQMLNDKYPRNAIFNGGSSRNELSDDEMAKIESQILPFGKGMSHVNAPPTSTSTSTTTTTTGTQIEINRNANAAIDDSVSGSGRGSSGNFGVATTINDQEHEATTLPAELNDTAQKWIDNIFSVGAVNFEESRREKQQQQQQQQQAQQRQQNEATIAGETVLNVANANNYETASPEEDLQQQQQIEQDYVVEDTQQLQQEQQQQVQVQVEDLSDFQVEQHDDITYSRQKRPNVNVGAPINVDLTEAKLSLEDSLSKVAAGEGPKYMVEEVYSATSQMVSGTLLIIDAGLKDDQESKLRCQIVIWSRPWLKKQPIETDINCPDKPRVKQRHSRSVDDAEKKTHKKHNHHNLGKVEHLFHKFQTRYSRAYESSMERQMRLRIFRQNIRTIEELNRNEQGSAKYGITEFADMTSAEYKLRTGLWQRDNKPSTRPVAEIPDIDLPKEFDWREKGVISKVKNQGNCGSCWAFSVTGNIEGLHAVKTGQLEEYSEQELLDCDTTDSACNGGLMDNAYKAIENIGGLELESEYPYEARKEHCHFNKSMVHVKVNGFVDLPKNETQIAQWLLANGPISIGINANAMQFYRGGVSHPWRPLCSHSNLDHGVLIVGYGVSEYPMFKKTLPYWIVKNSWGPKWGEQGYYRVYRGDNTCGVSEMATSAVLQ